MPVEILLQFSALGIYAYHYWDSLPYLYNVIFISSICATNIWRFIFCNGFKHFTPFTTDGQKPVASTKFLVSNAILGATWGGGFATFSFLNPQFSLTDSTLTVLIFSVILANMAGSASWSRLFLSFTAPALLLPITALLIQGAFAEGIIWGQLLLVCVLTYWGTIKAEKAIYHYRQHGQQNVRMIKQLASAKQNAVDNTITLQRTQDKLKAEIEERKTIEEKIRASEQEMARILADMQDTYFQVDNEGTLIRLSPSVELLTGIPSQSLIGTAFAKLFVSPHELQMLMNGLEQKAGSVQNFEARIKNTMGDVLWVSINAHYSSSSDDASDGFEGTARDITLNKLAEEAIFQEKERMHVTLESIGDGVTTTDPEGKIVYLNPVAEKMSGWIEKDAVGKKLEDVLKFTDETTRQSIALPINKWLTKKNRVQFTDPVVLTNRRKTREYTVELSASPLQNSKGEVIGLVFVFHNVTKLRTLARQLSFQAAHDALTGLINRREFENRVQEAINTAEQDNKHHAMLYIDLDQFKVVNDTCGHHAGDKLLKQLTSKLRELLRESDTLARLGGDEFGVLLVGCPIEQANQLAEKIREEVEEYRFAWEGRVFRVGASIGLVPITPQTRNLTELLSAADSACYVAKEGGRNQVHVYEPDDQAVALQQGQMQWMQRIQRALEKNLFELHFQSITPVKNTTNKKASGEVLLRMIDEHREAPDHCILPGAFIPSAERYQLMPKIDRWVIAKTFALLSNQKDILQHWEMCSINISGQSIGDPKLLDYILNLLNKTKLPPAVLCFEITESAVIANLDVAQQFIRALQKLGCRFALDDFGSGVSSFAYLKNLPVDFVKLDGSLIKDVAKDKSSYAMVEAINIVAHVMEIKTVAEHIENVATIKALQEINVDYAQGNVIDIPQPFPEFITTAKVS